MTWTGETSVDEVVGVPQHDITAAPAILDRHEGEFFYVDNGKSGARGPGGEFRVWDGRVWKRDANEATVHRWIGAFWTALLDSSSDIWNGTWRRWPGSAVRS